VPLSAFATPADLGFRLDLTIPDEDERALALLDQASRLVRDAAGQTINEVTDDELSMPGTRADRITLPERPVVSIASVVLAGSALAEGSQWYLKGSTIYRLRDLFIGYGRSHYYRGFGWPRQTLVITYTHGYADAAIPGLVKAITMEAVARVWNNPEGLISERVGDTDVTFASYREPNRGMLITDGERKQLRRFFGDRGLSVTAG